MPLPLSFEEIGRLACRYAEATARVGGAGFDAVEGHGGHSYLLLPSFYRC